MTEQGGVDVVTGSPTADPSADRRDLQQTFRLLLATVWLTDAALQLQPFMFTRGANGFSGMLQGTARGNPTWIAHTITWNASIVSHQPVLTNALFAGTQFVIAFGIAWQRTCRAALALSIAWAIAVWWFGEGLGGLFTGAATPLGGGPGAVLFYAVLAVVLWPSPGPNAPVVAAKALGATAARALWAAVWLVLALLTVVGVQAGLPERCTIWWRGSPRASPAGSCVSTGGRKRSGCTTAPRSPCSSRCSAWWSP